VLRKGQAADQAALTTIGGFGPHFKTNERKKMNITLTEIESIMISHYLEDLEVIMERRNKEHGFEVYHNLRISKVKEIIKKLRKG
jgi:hypothetical protein